MPVGLHVAIALLAQAAPASASAYGPAAPPPPASTSTSKVTPQRVCAPQSSDPKANEIVVCAIKPEGYRLPPDIVEARRLKKEGGAGAPRSPHETYADHSCANVGPMGCRGAPTINLLAAAAVAAEIGKRLAKGQEIGSLFETTPAPTDYQYFLEAKKLREEKEAETAAAKAKAKANAAISASQPAASDAQAIPKP
jgi:hypothetical protein